MCKEYAGGILGAGDGCEGLGEEGRLQVLRKRNFGFSLVFLLLSMVRTSVVKVEEEEAIGFVQSGSLE